MAYIHCHNCGWQQDDFYGEHYNPARSLKDWDEVLFGEERGKLDQPFPCDPEFVRENGEITYREIIAREYEKYAARIRRMRWVTLEDFRNEKEENQKCPACGSTDLDMD